MNTPGERIKWALVQRDVSAGQLARSLELTRAAVCLWWSKRHPTSPYKHLERIADLLGVRVAWLLTGQDEPMRQGKIARAKRTVAAADIIGAELIGIADADMWQERCSPSRPSARRNGRRGSLLGQAQPPAQRSMRPFAFEVHGTSANQTIQHGEYAICADFRLARPAGPHEGDLVIACKRRPSNDEKLFVARLHHHEDRWELRYNSHDPHWRQEQPIRLSPDLTHDTADRCPIDIIGHVFGVFRRNSQPSCSVQDDRRPPPHHATSTGLNSPLP